MKNNNEKTTAINLLFSLSLEVYVFRVMFGNNAFVQEIDKFLGGTQLFLILMCVLVNIKKYSLRQIALQALFVVVSLVTSCAAGNFVLLYLALVLLSAQNINVEKVIKIDLFVKIIYLVFNGFLLVFGVLEDSLFLRQDGTVRHTFGFSSPNTFGIILLSILVGFYFVGTKKTIKIYRFLLPLIAFGLLVIFDSRSSVISVLLLWVLVMMQDKVRLNPLLRYLPLLLLALSFLLVLLYGANNQIALIINDITTGRLIAPYELYVKNGISFLGREIVRSKHWLGYVDVIDNSYLNLIIRYGIIQTIIMTLLNISLYKNAIKSGNQKQINILLVYSIMGLMENVLFSVAYNPIWLFLKESNTKEEK